jgi:hypothetical protein
MARTPAWSSSSVPIKSATFPEATGDVLGGCSRLAQQTGFLE